MANILAQMAELVVNAQKIISKLEMIHKEFEVAMSKKDGKAMDEARAIIHELVDQNLDLRVNLERLKNKNEEDILSKLKKF